MKNFDKHLSGNRIKERRLELKLTLAELGRSIGVAPSTIQRYETGVIIRPKVPVVKAIANALGVNYSWITGESDSMLDIPSNAIPTDLRSNVRIPVIGKVAGGYSCHAEEYIEGYEYASADSVKSGTEYVYLRVKGDSMSPVIMEGDLVLVRCQDVVENGSYAVAIIDNEDGVVKKIYISKGRIELRSENPYYPPRVFVDEECARVRVFGKVVECKRKF